MRGTIIAASAVGLLLGCLAINFSAHAQLPTSNYERSNSEVAQTQFDQGASAYERQDYAEAVRLWQLAANNGHIDAQLSVAHHFHYGLGVAKSEETALFWYDKAAAQGNEMARDRAETLRALQQSEESQAAAQVKAERQELFDIMARAYEAYKNQNYSQARTMWKSAADKGDPMAMHNIGWLHESAKLGENDYYEAVAWYEKAAALQLPEAYMRLGDHYYQGYHLTKSYEKARDYYLKAARQGMPEAMYSAGAALVNLGHQDAGYDWIYKAAEKDYPKALLHLGYAHDEGKGPLFGEVEGQVEQSYSLAKSYYTKLANMGDPQGMFYLGMLYRMGNGVPKSEDMAQHWFLKAARLGGMSGKIHLNKSNEKLLNSEDLTALKAEAATGNVSAQALLGLSYLEGTHGTRSPSLAEHWLTKASNAGNNDARFGLVTMTLREGGVSANPEAARDQLLSLLEDDAVVPWQIEHWVLELGENHVQLAEPLMKAAADHEQASETLLLAAGIYFRNRSFYTQDASKKPAYKDAHINYLMRAANKGYVEAEFFLGAAYSGEDDEKARYWYEKAAEKGHTTAMKQLGFMYEFGEGVSKDLEKATQLYQQAADLGDEFAGTLASVTTIHKNRDDAAAERTRRAEAMREARETEIQKQKAEEARVQRHQTHYYRPQRKQKCGFGCWLAGAAINSGSGYSSGYNGSSSSSYSSSVSQPTYSRELTYNEFHTQQWLKSPSNYYQNRYKY